MKKIILIISLLAPLFYSQSEFKVDFDYANFHYNDSLSYLELYYAFYQGSFQRINIPDSLPRINGELKVQIKNAGDQSIIVNREYQFSTYVDTSEENVHKGLTGVLNFLIPTGNYLCRLIGLDLNAVPNSDSIEFNIIVKPTPADRFSLSDIELAASIMESETDSGMFYKNTYEVLPNPGNVYGGILPVIFFYSEIYNIDISPGSENLKVENILINSSDQVFYKKAKLITRNNASVVELGTINISKAPSGAYTLIIAVTDSIKNLSIFSSKRLFIYNPGIVDSQSLSGGDNTTLPSEFTTMSEEELDEAFAESRYIATDYEQKQWEKVTTEDAKRQFLYNFWNARDKNTSTPQNEYKIEYFNRVKLANERYATMQKKGWRTDRGRVLILYGEPSDIERYPNQVDTKPYEIWNYEELEGGVVFVFADLTGYNDYIIIHSTMRGELRDDFWMRKVRT